MLQDLEDKTPLLLEQKQAYETLKRNYHTLLLQWNQFCEQTLASSEGSFTDSTKLLYAEVLRLREEVASAQRQVELLRSQRDALRSKLLLRGGVRVGGVECSEKKESVEVSDVEVSDVKVGDEEVCKEKEKEKVEKEKEKEEKEKVEKEKVEKEEMEKEKVEKACELSQLRESAKRLERRLQEAEGRRKRAEARSQSLQSQLARCERALAEIGLNSDTTRLSRMSALAMVSVWRRSDGKELRSHFDETATVLLRSLVDGNARIQGYLERGLESVAQLQTKLTVPETPAPLLEVNEEGEEKPLSEAISALVEQNADLEETMREMEGDEDEMNRDLEAKAARITVLEAEVKALAAEKAKMVEEVAKVARLTKKEEKSDGRIGVYVAEAEGVMQTERAKEAEALQRGQQEVGMVWGCEA